MSIEKKTFAVALLGVVDAEKAILERTFGFTTSLERTRAYQVVNGKTPDIVIVNADDPTAMTELQSTHLDNEGNSPVPIVYAAGSRPTGAKYHIRRPWFAARILKTLDEVTVGEMDFIPEFTIDDSAPTDVSRTVSRAQKAVTEERPAPAVSSPTALIVDDSLPVRKQVEMELKLHGINAELVESGEQALEAIKVKQYDAIFLDVMMPGINGYQTCKSIKADPINRHTPVIMLTGKTSSFDKVKGKFAGCDSYITKPVGRTEFQKIVKQYLSNGFKE